MTIFFPDVSSYTPDVDPAEFPVLIARATLSSSISDPTYPVLKRKATAAGTVFVAYHWLNHNNIQAQARWCFQNVGPDIPLMIDAEDEPGNTGYNGPLTIDDILGFATTYRTLGGTVSLCYLPFWYWAGAMSAVRRLGELPSAGLHLVSSNYPNGGYTENGPGWEPYYPGAPAPVQWQYTSTPVDMNAFKGSVDDYRRMIGMAAGDADKAFSEPYYGSEPWISGQSWVSKALEGPLRTANGKLDDLATKVGGLAAPQVTATLDPAALKAVLLDPDVLAAIAKAVNDDESKRLAG